MKNDLVESLVKVIANGYEDEHESVIKDYGIKYKSKKLNLAKVLRQNALYSWIISQDSDRFVHIDKQSFVFIDKLERSLYTFIYEENLKQIKRKFNLGDLTYLSGAIYLTNPSKIEMEDEKNHALFDVKEYTKLSEDQEWKLEAEEKTNQFLENYKDEFDNVYVITRDSSKEDNPSIKLHHFSRELEILSVENWSRFIPANYGYYKKAFELEENSMIVESDRKIKKFARLRKDTGLVKFRKDDKREQANDIDDLDKE